MSYEFQLLGPVGLVHDGESVPLGPAKRRAMLAALALDANSSVSLARLAESLWAGPPPASAVANLRTHAAALRRVLGDRLVARPGAYQLRVEDGEQDAARFVRLALAGRQALLSHDPTTAVLRLSAALGLWRGAAGDGLPRGTRLEERLSALDEQRLDVFEDYVQARQATSIDPDLAAELRRHLARHPLRERGWAQLMITLYRAGNVAGALIAYADARAVLHEQLGIEPGPELVALQRAILDRDPSLDNGRPNDRAIAEPPSEPAGTADWTVAPRQLPPDTGLLIGRSTELAATVEALHKAQADTSTAAVVVSGRAGVGKSVLAVRAAHLVADEFPDGHISVELGGNDPQAPPRHPEDVVAQVLRAFGVPASEVPDTADESAAAYRSLVTNRRVLVLLDDAATAAQVRPLIPPAAGCVLLVTARRPLAAIDGMVGVDLGLLSPRDAADLITEFAGRKRAEADPASVAQLARLCAGLPLALRIVGARLASRPEWPLALVTSQLADRPLDALEFDDLSVRERFAADYLLTAAADELAARTFRLLGVVPEQTTPQAAAAQLDEPAGLVFHALERLVDARLADSPRPGHYRVPDLLRLYAADLAAVDDPRAEAVSANGRSFPSRRA